MVFIHIWGTTSLPTGSRGETINSKAARDCLHIVCDEKKIYRKRQQELLAQAPVRYLHPTETIK